MSKKCKECNSELDACSKCGEYKSLSFNWFGEHAWICDDCSEGLSKATAQNPIQ